MAGNRFAGGPLRNGRGSESAGSTCPWSFQESDGADCFVTVSASPDGTICTGYEENYYQLTPEQFMLGDYYNVF